MRTPQERAELTDWAEQRGMDNLREHIAAMRDLKEEGNRTLAIFMAIAGASFAYAANHVGDPSALPLTAGAFALGAHFVTLCALLLHHCLKIENAPVVANQGPNLFNPDYTVQQVKEVEIKNLEERRRRAAARNERMGRWLNGLRYGALASPFTFFLLYCLATRYQAHA